MKTLKSLFIISTILLVSGYSYATGKGPEGSDNVKNTVRQKIASAIESADISGKGQVTLKFGVTEKNNLQILKIESNDQKLNQSVKEALSSTNIIFPKGSKGLYQIKVVVNQETDNKFETVRDQVYNALENVKYSSMETVKVRFRVLNSSTVQLLKTDCANPKLAQEIKNAIEGMNYNIPKNLNGDYNLRIILK